MVAGRKPATYQQPPATRFLVETVNSVAQDGTPGGWHGSVYSRRARRVKVNVTLKTIRDDEFVSVPVAAKLICQSANWLRKQVALGRVEMSVGVKISGREVLRLAGPSFVAERSPTPAQRRKQWQRDAELCKQAV